MPAPIELIRILRQAYAPCPEFEATGACVREMRWQPEAGHVPRGFCGAFGEASEVELILVFAEPGDPHNEERHFGFESAYNYIAKGFREGLGGKAQRRLRPLGVHGVLPVYSTAPPGCNRRQAAESWKQIAIELRRRRRASGLPLHI